MCLFSPFGDPKSLPAWGWRCTVHILKVIGVFNPNQSVHVWPILTVQLWMISEVNVGIYSSPMEYLVLLYYCIYKYSYILYINALHHFFEGDGAPGLVGLYIPCHTCARQSVKSSLQLMDKTGQETHETHIAWRCSFFSCALIAAKHTHMNLRTVWLLGSDTKHLLYLAHRTLLRALSCLKGTLSMFLK